jgi:hypothetical protein
MGRNSYLGLIENHAPFPGLRNQYRNLKSENSQDYAHKPQRNCMLMNSLFSERIISISYQSICHRPFKRGKPMGSAAFSVVCRPTFVCCFLGVAFLIHASTKTLTHPHEKGSSINAFADRLGRNCSVHLVLVLLKKGE